MNIKFYRNKLEMTIIELSEKSRVSAGYISDLENGNVNNPSKDVMTKISCALGETVQEVFFNNRGE